MNTGGTMGFSPALSRPSLGFFRHGLRIILQEESTCLSRRSPLVMWWTGSGHKTPVGTQKRTSGAAGMRKATCSLLKKIWMGLQLYSRHTYLHEECSWNVQTKYLHTAGVRGGIHALFLRKELGHGQGILGMDVLKRCHDTT